ncbi:uncharacterized protein LOC143899669 [Temnothorax americanus]|uniref:uncharacterized protein LOC143899669 n=1 Tax=Temnothorax americanus TaxID=1964332 RepID=UPI0040698D79
MRQIFLSVKLPPVFYGSCRVVSARDLRMNKYKKYYIRSNNLKFDIRGDITCDKHASLARTPLSRDISVFIMSDQPFKARNAFHPADPPHGMQNYDVGALTRDQKQALNEMKMNTRKENEIYLKSHPEIRGFIGILLRHVLSKQPLIDIPEVVGTFFNRPRREIVAELLDYLSSADERSDITDDLRREVFRTTNVEASGSNDSSSDSDLCGCNRMNETP